MYIGVYFEVSHRKGKAMGLTERSDLIMLRKENGNSSQ